MASLIVAGYDGSDDARRALEVAGRQLEGWQVVIVHVWGRPQHPAPPIGGTLGAPVPPTEEETQAAERRARKLVEEGVEHARRQGLEADTVLVEGAGAGRISQALLAQADDHDADLVLVGRRGLSRLKAVILGSVADAVVRQARRPVLVVPTPD